MQDTDAKNIELGDMDLIENVIVAFRELWKKKMLILLVTMAGFLMALIIVNQKGNTLRYYSSATLFSAVYGATGDSGEGVAAMNRYVDMIGSSRVCERAAQTLVKYGISAEDLQTLVKNGSISVSGASTNSMSYGYKLQIAVFYDSSEEIIAIANAMSYAFAEELNELIGANAIHVMDEATKFSSFDTVNGKLYLLVITGGVFVAICGIIFLIAFFSPWVQSVAQCEQDEEYILGLVPYVKNM